MSHFYLTNPDKPPTRKNEHVTFDHKEDTVRELHKLGIPLRVAECAVIDLKSALITCQNTKLSPQQTADMMSEIVCEKYMKDDGRWLLAS